MKNILKYLLTVSGHKIVKDTAFNSPESRVCAEYHELLFSLFLIIPTPKIVVVGANDGIREDSLGFWIRNFKCNALMIEPVSNAYEVLMKNFDGLEGIQFLKAAISDSSGKSKIYFPKQNYADKVTDKSQLRGQNVDNKYASLDAVQVNQYVGYKGDINDILDFEEVSLMKLSEAIYQKVKWNCIDVLQIDAEGHDVRIVTNVLNEGIFPKVISVEISNSGFSEVGGLITRLVKLGYSWFTDDLNLYAMSSEFSSMRKKLRKDAIQRPYENLLLRQRV